MKTLSFVMTFILAPAGLSMELIRRGKFNETPYYSWIMAVAACLSWVAILFFHQFSFEGYLLANAFIALSIMFLVSLNDGERIPLLFSKKWIIFIFLAISIIFTCFLIEVELSISLANISQQSCDDVRKYWIFVTLGYAMSLVVSSQILIGETAIYLDSLATKTKLDISGRILIVAALVGFAFFHVDKSVLSWIARCAM